MSETKNEGQLITRIDYINSFKNLEIDQSVTLPIGTFALPTIRGHISRLRGEGYGFEVIYDRKNDTMTVTATQKPNND